MALYPPDRVPTRVSINGTYLGSFGLTYGIKYCRNQLISGYLSPSWSPSRPLPGQDLTGPEQEIAADVGCGPAEPL